ncbi:S8 family peptidase [Pontibacter sp. MBLB2868]|uniref:S8 family peptidase n=1 Tax=Pontibacter sp. MBLB2868 TaxID=3451555 RepID=UPI003F752287
MASLYKYTFSRFWLLAWLLSCLPLTILAQQKNASEVGHPLTEKLAPSLHKDFRKGLSGSYRVVVLDEVAYLQWLQLHKLQPNSKAIPGYNKTYTLSRLSSDQLSQLLSSPFTAYVDRTNRVAKEEMELKDADFIVNNIPAVHSQFPSLNGSEMIVSVKEGAFNPNDLDLKGRVLSPESIGAEYTSHATTMATLIAGAGNSGPKGKGIAAKAYVASSDFQELLPDNSTKLLEKGITIQNHSYGVGVENYYGLEAAAYDQQTFQNPQLLHIFSSGNSGNKADATGPYANLAGFANLTGQFKTSKNTLSVGALDPDGTVGVLSSRGPAFDGRIKPELVAYGKGGTSEAAAVVSGVAALVQQAYKQNFSGNVPAASLVKAVLINSADDVGRPAVDFESGFGNTDALGAVRTIQDKRFFTAQINEGSQNNYPISIPSGVRQLKATLVWHDPQAHPNPAAALINDLDLLIRNKATGASWRPWVLSTYPHPDSLHRDAWRGVDRINNVEQVSIMLPDAGTYELLVQGHKVPGQLIEYSVAYEYESGLEWLYPSTNTILEAGSINLLHWQGSVAGETARLEYRFATEQVWHLVKEVNLTNSFTDWHAPDTAAIAQLRLVTSNQEILSGAFILSRQLRLQVGFKCDENAMVFWQPLKGASAYQLYRIGKTNLEPFLTTPDTLAILDKKTLAELGEFIAVAPLIQGKEALTSDVVAYERQITGCYIKSFLPEQFVMDTVMLNLELGTLYNLTSVTLERQQGGNFIPALKIAPVTMLSIKLQDLSAKQGSNFYRVRVETKEGATYVSQTEEVVFVKPGYVQVYPNPVEIGQPLSIAISNDSAILQLYDQLGKLVYESEENAVVKSLDTAHLQKGLYILRLLTSDGGLVTTRIVVL